MFDKNQKEGKGKNQQNPEKDQPLTLKDDKIDSSIQER